MMTNNWHSVIYMKSPMQWEKLQEMMKWDGVESMWSTSGKWDWCIKLDKGMSTPEKTEAFVARMRDGKWATETQTNWWKEMPR